MKSKETGYIKYLTEKEFKLIYKWVIKRVSSPSMKMLIQCLLFLGLRKGDTVQLKRKYFSKNWETLNIPEMEKTKKPIEIYVPKLLQKRLKKFYKKYKKYMVNDYLFFASYKNQSKNEHIQKATINYKFIQLRNELNLNHVYYVKKTGQKLQRISPHTLRHFVAYRINEVSNIQKACEWLGHTKISTTSKYINALKSANDREKIGEKAFSF